MYYDNSRNGARDDDGEDEGRRMDMLGRKNIRNGTIAEWKRGEDARWDDKVWWVNIHTGNVQARYKKTEAPVSNKSLTLSREQINAFVARIEKAGFEEVPGSRRTHNRAYQLKAGLTRPIGYINF